MLRFRNENGVEIPLTPEEETARDAEEKEWADGKTKRDALSEIHRLESTVTNRRLRDALASDEGKTWITDVEALIATERNKL